MRFSQRIGKSPIRDALQTDGMDTRLRNGLWNALYTVYISLIGTVRIAGHSRLRTFYGKMWHEFFRAPLDTIGIWATSANEDIRKWFFEAKWHEVYDFIEYLVKSPSDWGDPARFADLCNEVLECELSGWRIIGSELVQVTDEVELTELETGIAGTKGTKFSAAGKHLETAVQLLFDRKSPDPRNSIKESISAVEAAAASVTSKPKATLGQALKVLEKKQ